MSTVLEESVLNEEITALEQSLSLLKFVRFTLWRSAITAIGPVEGEDPVRQAFGKLYDAEVEVSKAIRELVRELESRAPRAKGDIHAKAS